MLIGLDFGTGGAKASVLSPEGRVLGHAYEEYPLIHEHPGWSEHDATQYWPVAVRLVRSVLRDAGVSGRDVAGVGVSSALPSLVVVGADGAPLCPAINLLDRRAREEVDLVRSLVGTERVQALSANRLEDHPSLVNLVWIKRNRPSVFGQIRSALTIDGYVTFGLTDEVTVNRSAGAFYGVAYDIRRGRFDEEVLDIIGIPAKILPEVVDCRAVVGGVTAKAAEATGLAVGTPVVGGQVDCNAAWIAGGAVSPGDVQLNLGTSGVLGVVHDKERFLSSESGQSMVNIPYTTDPQSVFSAVATTMTGGAALRYLRETFGAVEQQVGLLLGVSSYDLLTLQARDIPPGSEGLVVLPYLMGERTPIWDSAARGVVFGLSLHHGRGHIFRAFMEGVAYALHHSLSVLLEGGLDVNWPLVLNEGGARSEVWRRIVTDVLGVPTVLLKSQGGAPLGDAILAGVAIGEFEGFGVAREWARYGEVLVPDSDVHEQYMEFYALYRGIYSDLQGRFEELHGIMTKSS
ncbi:MAG: FGGY-family carbohydrate kinase [Candidatus Dormibacteria bacterium]